ncbi:hypothetical protein ACM66B_002823 [Microbotryomycetes sp. NB124-2]
MKTHKPGKAGVRLVDGILLDKDGDVWCGGCESPRRANKFGQYGTELVSTLRSLTTSFSREQVTKKAGVNHGRVFWSCRGKGQGSCGILMGNERGDAAWQQPALNEQRPKGSKAPFPGEGHRLTNDDVMRDPRHSDDAYGSSEDEDQEDEQDSESEDERESAAKKRVKSENARQTRSQTMNQIKSEPSSSAQPLVSTSQAQSSQASTSQPRNASQLQTEFNEATSLLDSLKTERAALSDKRDQAKSALADFDQQVQDLDALMDQVGGEVTRLTSEVDERSSVWSSTGVKDEPE